MQQKITWLDTLTEATLDDELSGLESNQEFLEQFYAVSMLLEVLNQTREVAKVG